MNFNFKKVAAVVAACALCVSTGFFSAYAATVADGYNGKVGEFVYVQSGAREFINTDNFFGSTNYNQANAKIYMPGDSITGSVEIKNENPEKVNLFLIAGPTSLDKYKAYANANGITGKSPSQLKSLSEKLVKEIELTVKYTDASGNVKEIYNGKMSGAMYDSKTMLSTINLGSYPTNAMGKLDFTLNVPKTLDGQYNGAVGMIDWIFTAEGIDPPPPATGEEAIPYALAAVGCAVSAIAILVVTFRNAKKEEDCTASM